MTEERIRGLEETIAAQAQRLAEIARLRDLAHEAKGRLIADHATERSRRHALEAAVDDAASVISGLLDALDGRSPANATPRASAIEQARAWLAEHGASS